MERKLAWEKYSNEELNKVFDFANEYKKFVTECKTERECAKYAVELAKANGFVDINELIANKTQLKPNDKVYVMNMDKTVAFYVIGTEAIENGLNIIGAHIDSPRLDLKQNPLYEDSDLALLETHYYGGVKKYQWVALPLALHGVVALKDGSVVNVVIGEDASDPVVGVSDLLIHLAAEQLEKKGNKVVEGEDLNILVGNMPLSTADKDAKEKVKSNILAILKDKYGIEEEDFLSAELEAVPAGPARDYGIDRSMIMAYGHDDRVCAYPSFKAILSVNNPKKTCACILADKEEIGSVGATGMQSRFFENATAEVMNAANQYSDLALRRALKNSSMLSADVSSAYDPNYPSVSEKKNAAYLGRGIVFLKYTGSRGKSGSNDANAEFVAKLRKMCDDNNVSFQTAELGKVDLGGGGTIAYMLANYGMNVIDCGVAVQNMHAPWEVISKVDLYEALNCYSTFFKED